MKSIGIPLGAGLVLGFLASGQQAPHSRARAAGTVASASKFEALTSADHAAFARFGETLVASTGRYGGAKTYYAQPKPYGQWTCRVDVINLPGWIVEGRQKPDSKFWEDDLVVRTHYAAWRSPQERPDADRMAACKEFRQFDHLFYAGEGNDPERNIYVLDQLLRAIAKGSPAFKLTCIDRRAILKGNTCDPATAVRGITIHTPFTATSEDEWRVRGGQINFNTLRFDLGYEHEHPVQLVIEFESMQTYGKQSIAEGTITSARITIEVL